MRKLIAATLLTLAIAFVGAPIAWALETVTGTVEAVELQDDSGSIAITTMDGKSLVFEANPAELKGLEKGDEVEITAEGAKAEAVRKL